MMRAGARSKRTHGSAERLLRVCQVLSGCIDEIRHLRLRLPHTNTNMCLSLCTSRYEATKAWRAAERADDVLLEPQPLFQTIKRLYPQYYSCYADGAVQKAKGCVVYIEKPAQVVHAHDADCPRHAPGTSFVPACPDVSPRC